MEHKKSIIIDIDGTLCPIKREHEDYASLVPYPDVVNRLREYKAEGFRIVLMTSRNVRTYDGCLGLINKHTAKVLLLWLEKYDIPYDEIYYGKPWQGEGGFYVDDKTVRPDEFVNMQYDQIVALLDKSRS